MFRRQGKGKEKKSREAVLVSGVSTNDPFSAWLALGCNPTYNLQLGITSVPAKVPLLAASPCLGFRYLEPTAKAAVDFNVTVLSVLSVFPCCPCYDF